MRYSKWHKRPFKLFISFFEKLLVDLKLLKHFGSTISSNKLLCPLSKIVMG